MSIIFAGGCFWGVQHYFSMVRGVTRSKVGYIGGSLQNPLYENVKKGNTGHTEGCLVEYDSNFTNLVKLLTHFFFIIDPTLLNQQGNDMGTQYRTAIFYYTNEEKIVINDYINNVVKPKYNRPIVVEVESALTNKFWLAEEYHQEYLDKNPSGYCHISKDKYNKCRDIDVNHGI